MDLRQTKEATMDSLHPKHSIPIMLEVHHAVPCLSPLPEGRRA